MLSSLRFFVLGKIDRAGDFFISNSFYSTVTDLARLRGWSTSQPRRTAM